jgi:hypothetical protein
MRNVGTMIVPTPLPNFAGERKTGFETVDCPLEVFA